MKRLVQTSFDDLQPFMGLVFPKLVVACRYSIGRYEAGDIIEYIKTNHMQLWLAFDEEELDGFILTQIIDYPQAKALRFLCLMGVRIEGFQEFMAVIGDWLPFVRQVEEWAIGLGCVLSQIESPAAWELYMRDYGYKRGHVILDKELA
jgi:hypothetical protein